MTSRKNVTSEVFKVPTHLEDVSVIFSVISSQKVAIALTYYEAHASLLFQLPQNLSNHMDRQDRTPRDTVLVKSREMIGRSQTLSWWLGGGGVKTTENKIHWFRWEDIKVIST
jgi:hypothetical protein